MSTLFVTFWDSMTGSPIGDAELTVWPETPVSTILDALPATHAGAGCFVGAQPLDGAGTFGDSPIVAGCYISVGGPGPALHDDWTDVAGVLWVTSGPDSGQAFALSPGHHDIARRADVSVMLTDQEITRRGHARLTVSPGGAIAVEDLGSANGTWIDGVRTPSPGTDPESGKHPRQAAGAVPLPAGSELRAGGSAMRWFPRPPLGRSATRSPDGLIYFNRSFATAPAVPSMRARLPSTFDTPRNLWGLLIPLLLPMAAGIAMAVLLKQPTFLLFALLGPISGLASYLVDGRARKRRQAELARARAEVVTAVQRHLVAETARRHERAPGQAELLMAAIGMSPALWPRNADAHDGLVLRVGSADQPANVTFEGEPWPELNTPVAGQVPITVDLRAAGVLGVVGPPAQARGLSRWLAVQLATLRSPDDLRLVVITADDGAQMSWMRWLPHLQAGPDAPIPAFAGNTGPTRLRRAAELQELIGERVRASRGGSAAGARFEDVVVILDGALALRQTPGMKEILHDGPGVGVYSICVDTASMNEARAECRFELPAGAGAGPPVRRAVLHVTRSRTETAITAEPDIIEPAMTELIARNLAPVRDRLSLSSAGRSIPYPVRFLDLLQIPGEPAAAQVRALWRRTAGPATQVAIGADTEGVVTVDLAGQGPHTMLGGATGAGKSYLLQTLVTSLLMANSPDELNLVLVDFKGGSAFLPFQHCPHVVSLIRSTGQTAADVFDEAAATRMLASVRTEVRRRESLLAPYGGEIDEYWKARRSRPELAPLPRLVMIFDEFARVLEVAQDFLKELVNVAAKGRALGMHLVLATQSLQGKLSPELKNNIDLRITLRQNEPADSTEVLGVPDAARIPGRLRGRGLILCTKDEVRVPRAFQAGFLGAPPPQGGARPGRVRLVPWNAMGASRPDDAPVAAAGQTDQELCIRAIEEASAGTRAPFMPLLPPLPATLLLDQLGDWASAPMPSSLVPFGLADEPERQAQTIVGLDLSGSERVMVAGGPQQGRTMAARALIHGLAARWPADEVHLYVVEREPGGLRAFERLPHCGAVVPATQPDRLRRLIEWLGREVDRRRAARISGLLATHGTEAAIVVIVDGWELIENRSDPLYVETSLAGTFRDVVTAGVTVGIHVVAIGGQDMLNGKLPNLYGRRFILPFPKQDFRRQHVPQRAVNPPVLPGRAVDASDGRQVQLCVPTMADEELIQVARQAAAGLPASRLPVGVRALPQHIPVSELSTQGQPSSWIPIGVGGPEVETVGIDLFGEGSSLLMISGPAGSGRTTAARTVIDGLIARSMPLLVIAAGRSPLAGLTPIEGRLQVLSGNTFTDTEIRQKVIDMGSRDFSVVVDDCDWLTVQPTTENFAEQPTLLTLLCTPGEHRRALVLAGEISLIVSGRRRSLVRVVQEMQTSGHRLLLTPAKSIDAREQGFQLEADQLFAAPPGRGYLASGRSAVLVQIADSRASSGEVLAGPGSEAPSGRGAVR